MSGKPDGLTVIACALIGAGAAIYAAGVVGAVLFGLSAAGPFGLVGLLIFGMPAAGVGLLLIKVIRDRMNDPEDRHYSQDIHE